MKDNILKPGELVGVGKRLIRVREHLGLKQKQMAHKTRVRQIIFPGYF
jgi:transcriptional regulator with XRE-family HTH domain